MADAEPGWELYRSFLGVLKEGSLSGAARALGLTQPTVGRHVEALEQALGLSLFTRSQLGLAPTEAALALAPYAETLAATAAALLRVAESQGDGVRGTVRITASEVIGVEVLPPILAALREQHPALKIELGLTNRVEDLLKREADIAVRMVRPSQDVLWARRVGAVELGLHAREDYLARHGTPRSFGELLNGHAIIGFDRETAFLRGARKALGPLRRDAFSLRADSDLAQLAAIRAGYGIGVCQVGLARRDARLVRVLPKAFSLPLETWVTMHMDLRDNPRCRVAFEAVAEGLQGYIEGEAR
ncbi:LysR family transcriptional regulator [Polyangium sp. y55x31]|uniref:LysR family transcriptional regulator n=1 Tax=Polyangium sp. y55x31 TaxID=3042688 RepID=UPI002482C5AE|nr:LysR family transcriptional regulator [Polyangium sp. y55x31]MDI1480306.1 LysR family transcriptional regulator [Polyangium sp. y55x31]